MSAVDPSMATITVIDSILFSLVLNALCPNFKISADLRMQMYAVPNYVDSKW